MQSGAPVPTSGSGAPVPTSESEQVDDGRRNSKEDEHPTTRGSSVALRRWALKVLIPLFVFLVASFQQNWRVDLTGTTQSKSLTKAVFIPQPDNESGHNMGKEIMSNLSIVVQLSGEMGNHMSKIAAGIGVAMELRRYNATPVLKLKKQDEITKWVAVEKNMKKCFPSTTHLNISEAQDFDPSSRTSFEESIDDGINRGGEPESIQKAIRAAVQYATNNGTSLTLYSNYFTLWDYYTDLYYDRFRRFFRYADDNKFCCGQRPHSDETVFHYRQFTTEMPKRGIDLGFQEVSAIDLLEQILIPSNATSVAILSRFKNKELDDYADTLRKGGLSVRLILGQSPMQDFCFLKSTQRHLVGIARSTFFAWAAILSDAATITAYSIDSPSQRKWAERNKNAKIPLCVQYNWTNPKLIDRVLLPVIIASNVSNATTR